MKRDAEFWLLAPLLCLAGMLVTAFVVGDLSVSAATPEPVATATPINPCAEWGLAGAQIIFKCVDEEPPYAVCYVPVGGVMQCLIE